MITFSDVPEVHAGAKRSECRGYPNGTHVLYDLDDCRWRFDGEGLRAFIKYGEPDERGQRVAVDSWHRERSQDAPFGGTK